jgi:glycosyltransferase involved in cell wall biosynthesis
MIIPGLNFGGAQRSFSSLANQLSQRHNVCVCTFNTFDGIAYKYPTEIIDLRIPGGSNLFLKIYRFYRRYTAIYTLKKKLRIDTSISYLEGANYLNILTKSKDKVIVSVRGSKYYDPNISNLVRYLRLKILIPVIYKFADQVVALNNGIERELVTGFGLSNRKVKVIRNFYNISSIQKSAQQPITDRFHHLSRSKYIIYSGRLAKEKGLVSIIDCFAKLIDKIPDLKLVLVGEGPIHADLKNHAMKKGLEVFEPTEGLVDTSSTQIYFLGYQENPYSFLRNALLLLIASKSEGGPNILFESMICNTLVVSADCPYGPREIIAPSLIKRKIEKAHQGEFGVLLPVIKENQYEDSIREWANSIEKYLNDSIERESIIQRAEEHVAQYTPEKIQKQWEELI